MGHSYGLLTPWDIPMDINFMGHSYGLLTAWDIPMVYYLHGIFLWFINCIRNSSGLWDILHGAWFINFMRHGGLPIPSYGLLTSRDIPMVY